MGESIASDVGRCLDLFGTVGSTHASPSEPSFFRDVRDEHTRFKVWSGNMGAHRTGMSSLDYRLRDSSHIRTQVVRLLQDLIGLLEDAAAILAGNESPWDRLGAEQDDEAGARSGSPDTELGQISTNVADVVNCLLRLSVAIRNPAPHHRFVESSLTDTSYYDFFDIQHIYSKFGSIDPVLAQRLGRGISQTSYATSTAKDEQRRVPPLPAEAARGPFECPFCYMMIVVADRPSWKRHVYEHLRPYICLAKDCMIPEREFARRHQWMDHVKQNHWKVYKCPFACGWTFASASEYQRHVVQRHAGAAMSTETDALIMLSAQPLDLLLGLPCPLCEETLDSIQQYQRHVGRHQEQLALFALPDLESNDDSAPDGDKSFDADSVDSRRHQDRKGSGRADADGSNSTTPVPRTPRVRQNEYFIARNGIDREVIAADICRYLGNDTTVRPGLHETSETGQVVQGYYITSYRNLTTAMIEDLKADSARWHSEKLAQTSRNISENSNAPRYATVSPIQYRYSETHHSRNYGPTEGAPATAPTSPTDSDGDRLH